MYERFLLQLLSELEPIDIKFADDIQRLLAKSEEEEGESESAKLNQGRHGNKIFTGVMIKIR